MRITRDFYNCANCNFGKALKEGFKEGFKEDYQCSINETEIKADGVCSYYIWDRKKFDERKLKVVD